MGMKLLAPFQTKDRQQEELARKVIRIQEIEKVASQANAKLALAEADFNDAMARNRSIWATEEEEHNKRVKSMTEEIESLEERKKQALIPIQMYKKEADTLMYDAQEILKKAEEKQEYIDEIQEKLEEKLTDVKDREKLLEKEEHEIQIAKEGIKTQKQQIQKDSIELSEKMIAFAKYKNTEGISIDTRKKEIALAEINLNAKIDKYKRDLEALKQWGIQLKDERETLDREYRRKK